MKKYSILFLMCMPLFFAGCGSDRHSVQHGSSNYRSSNQKGKNKMPTQSPMLNEIFAIPQRNITYGESISVNHIVTKYIPIGTSKEQTKQILDGMHQNYKEEGNTIHAGYRIESHPMTPKRGVKITLKYNESGFLKDMDAGLTTRF